MSFVRIYIAALLSVSTILSACDFNPKAWKTPNMIPLSPRLQPMFEKTKKVCFGRFLIDVPESAAMVWGDASVPLRVIVYKNQASKLNQEISDREAALKAEERYPLSKKLSLYFETIDGSVPGLKHIVSQQDFSSTGMLRIESFYPMGSDLVKLSALPLDDDKEKTIAELNDIARRLRPRAETEIPSEPGVCLEDAFLADKPGDPSANFEVEHVRVGFRLKEFPDTHFSIYTAAKDEVVESDALKPRIERAGQEARENGFGALRDRVKFFRQGDRTFGEISGYEALARIPIVEHVGEHHEFHFVSLSAAKNPYKPMFDIELATGVKDNVTGAVPPSLTDEEAIALWDKLISSIRVRPTGSVKTSEAAPELPLGSLAATGRICPQTGWWDCAEASAPVQGGRRQFFHVGDVMPDAVLLGKPGLLQRMRGDAPSYRTATVWELVSYERSAASPSSTAVPVSAQDPDAVDAQHVAGADGPTPPSARAPSDEV